MFFQRGFRISRRRVILFAGDAVFIVGSIILSSILRLNISQGWDYIVEHIPTLTCASLIFLLVFYAGGMYEQVAVRRKAASFLLPLVTVAVSLVIIILAFYARFQFHLGRGILLLAGAFIFCFAWLIRRLYRMAVGYGLFLKNAIIVGEGEDIVRVLQLLANADDKIVKVFGIVSCNETYAKAEFVEGVPVLGDLSNLKEFADVYSIETIIIATSVARENELLKILRPLRYSGTEIMDYVALYEELSQEIPLDHINDEWLMNAAMNSSVVHIRKVKRMMDLSVAIFGLLISLPITLITMLLIRLESRGPIFYKQVRTGLDGDRYTVYKFRTMRSNAEVSTGAVWSSQNDSRITKVGHVLRMWRIDEIPQLVNVLKGEMSLVGPRPERPEFVETLAKAIPFFKERLLVPPGITGWAQVKYPYAASIEAARRKLQYDLYYIKHMSFFLDMLILLRTFKTIIVGLKHHDELAGDEKKESEATMQDYASKIERVS